METIIKQVKVPAGKYILGDPCYTVPDDLWTDLLESCDFFDEKSPVGWAGKYEVLAFGTMYGDGTFQDSRSNKFSVDAGLIGLVPWELGKVRWAEWEKSPGGSDEIGKVVEFTEPTLCGSEDDGTLVFGNYAISTGDEEQDSCDCDDSPDWCFTCQDELGNW